MICISLPAFSLGALAQKSRPLGPAADRGQGGDCFGGYDGVTRQLFEVYA